MRRALKPAPGGSRRISRKTKATPRAVRVAAGRIPLAARGRHPFPQEARNWVCCREDRVLIPCFRREYLYTTTLGRCRKRRQRRNGTGRARQEPDRMVRVAAGDPPTGSEQGVPPLRLPALK